MDDYPRISLFGGSSYYRQNPTRVLDSNYVAPPSAPTRAETAASNAATRAAASNDVPFAGYGTNPGKPSTMVDDRIGDFSGLSMVADASGAVLPAGATQVAPGVYRQGNSYGDSAAALTQTRNQAQLPSVPAFLRGVKTFGTGTAAASDDATTTRSTIASLLQRAQQLSSGTSLYGKIQASGLYKRAAALAGNVSAEAGAAYGQGQLALGAGHLGVAQGQLGLETQKAQPSFVQSLAVNKLLQSGDYQGARRLSAVLHGQNPDAPIVVPGPLGTTTLDPSTSRPGLHIGMQGDVSEYDQNQPFPRFTMSPGR
jgi:hypothetical protein